MRDDAPAPGRCLVLRGEQAPANSRECHSVFPPISFPFGEKEERLLEVHKAGGATASREASESRRDCRDSANSTRYERRREKAILGRGHPRPIRESSETVRQTARQRADETVRSAW